MPAADDIVTYSLRNHRTCSCGYYEDIEAFVDEVIAKGEEIVGPLIDTFRTHIHETDPKALRTAPEYVFDLLTLGILWDIYGHDAVLSHSTWEPLLKGLNHLRKRGSICKPVIDLFRGVGVANLRSARNSAIDPRPQWSTGNTGKLIKWLNAAGDFPQEAKRLQGWNDFFINQNIHEMDSVSDLAEWFTARSQEVLGQYTPFVERFLSHTHPNYRGREDYIFCGRQQVEYHLNMVGTEILNRAFRNSFQATTQKIVLLPPCMRARPEGVCQAQPTSFGYHCAGCTDECRVFQTTRLGKQYKFDVFILPEELRVFSNEPTNTSSREHLGVVGVSCALTNAPGGWETRALGIPSQGILLDYCGCSWHWHREGIPTDIDTHRLMHILAIDE